MHLKHPESLINFIAAYGTHSPITGRDHAGGQARRGARHRAGHAVRPSRYSRQWRGLTFAPPADRLDFLNSTGAWANDAGPA